jgi:hypothetical protein
MRCAIPDTCSIFITLNWHSPRESAKTINDGSAGAGNLQRRCRDRWSVKGVLMSFAITVLPAVAGHRWVCVEGLVDAATAGDMRATLRAALAMPTRRLTIDLRQARLDDVGHASLDEMTAYASQLGIPVRILRPADAAADRQQPTAPQERRHASPALAPA